MKKVGLMGILFFGLILGACGKKEDKPATSETEKATTSTVNKEKEKVVTELNKPESIDKNGKPMYRLEATKVVDVTEKEKNDLINDTNYLDYYSNGQGKQAVEITLKMTNLTDKPLLMPYLDNIKVIDSDGTSSLGGWKNENGQKTEFGYAETDSKGNVLEEKYEVKPGETKLATSTVLLATPSDKIKFIFDSSMFKDKIAFELPVNK